MFWSRIRSWLGPLGIGVVLVFIGSRAGDLANLFCRIYLGMEGKLDLYDFGALDPVLAFLAFVQLPISGLLQVVIKSLSRLWAQGKHEAYRALLMDVVVFQLITLLVVTIVILCFPSYVVARLHLVSAAYLFPLLLILQFMWWYPVCYGFMLAERHFLLLAVFYIISAIMLSGLTVLMVGPILHWGLFGALLARGSNVLMVIVLMLGILFVRLRGSRKRDTEEMRLLKEMLIPNYIFIISLTMLMSAPFLFIRNFLVHESGGYGAISTVGIIPYYFIANIVVILFPLASAEHAGGRQVRSYYLQSMILGVVILFVSAVLYPAVGPWIMKTWNPNFMPYSSLLWVYAVATGLHGMILIVASMEMARHRYGFIRFIFWPALAMCGLFYYWRGELSLSCVVWVQAFTHALVMGLLLLDVFVKHRRINVASPV